MKKIAYIISNLQLPIAILQKWNSTSFKIHFPIHITNPKAK